MEPSIELMVFGLCMWSEVFAFVLGLVVGFYHLNRTPENSTCSDLLYHNLSFSITKHCGYMHFSQHESGL